MKQLFYLLLLIGLIACENNENTSQEPTLKTVTVTPINTGNDETLTDLSFGTASVGYICGSMGTLLKSTDKGDSWTKVRTDIQSSLNCIQAIDDKNVYTARNELYHTPDGGATWETSGPENSGSGIFDLHFVNQSTGFITKNGVMKSADAGKTWTLKFDAAADEEYYALNYDQLQFLNETVGYCAGGKTYEGSSVGNMVKTVDGGETWINMKMTMSEITSFHFLDANNGFIFNFNQELWKTTDGGTTWVKVSSEVPDKYPDCYFINASKIVLRTAKNIYHSIDGGLSWSKDFTLDTENGVLTRMKFVDSKTGYVIGNDGFLARISLK